MNGIMGTIAARSSGAKAIAKSQLASQPSSYEVRNHRFSMSISGEKKLVNGTETVSFKLDSFDCYPCNPGEAMPLNEEFTDVNKFVAAVSAAVKAKAEAL